MLNENDIHYLSGFLYLVSNAEPASVVLGDKIYDVASETERDVDIVVIQSGKIGFIGAEVKNHARPLDVGHIDGISSKLNDMPSIEERYIISASGYTAPALKKAKSHNLVPLTIKKGKIPPFPTVDISKLENISIMNQTWIEGPVSTFVPAEPNKIPESYDRLVDDSTEIVWKNEKSSITNAKQFADAIARKFRGWQAPQVPGEYEVDRPIKIEDEFFLKINGQLFPMLGIIAKGKILVTQEKLPLDQSRYLEDEQGNIFAGAVMLEWNGHLTGVCASDKSQYLGSFFLPDSLRKIRPIRFQL